MIKTWFENVNKILFLWVGSFILNSITFLFIQYKIHPSNRTLALHYNVIVGVDWYGPGKNLYSIPLAAFLITAANLVLFRAVKKNQSFLSFLAAIIALIVQIVFLVAVLLLSRVN